MAESEVVKKRKVLVVDDEGGIREPLVHFLESVKSFDVIAWAVNGEDAIRLVETELSFGGFDLIITDVNMPILSGLELVKEIRTNYNEYQRFIVMSGGFSEKDKGILARFGLSDYALAKPFSKDQLLVMITKVLSEG